MKPQHLLVEEKGLENQIKRLKSLTLPLLQLKSLTFDGAFSPQYLNEQLTTIVLNLEDIKLSIKSENDRILKDQLKELI